MYVWISRITMCSCNIKKKKSHIYQYNGNTSTFMLGHEGSPRDHPYLGQTNHTIERHHTLIRNFKVMS